MVALRLQDVVEHPASLLDLRERLRPLLPSLIARAAPLCLRAATTHGQDVQVQHAWTSLRRYCGAAGNRRPCGNPTCATVATAEAPFKCCSQCRWVLYCSPACLVRSSAIQAGAHALQRADWRTHKPACTILAS